MQMDLQEAEHVGQLFWSCSKCIVPSVPDWFITREYVLPVCEDLHTCALPAARSSEFSTGEEQWDDFLPAPE
jgi:hypothetical protein